MPPKSSVRYVLEPVVLMFIFATMTQVPVLQQYVYKTYSKNFKFTYEYTNDSSTCGLSINNITQEMLQNQVQAAVAKFNIGLSFCWAIATIASCLCYGVLSDRIGRKKFLILNCIGSGIDAGLTLSIMIFNLPVQIIYVGVALNGICGGYMGLYMICYAYLADVCESERLPMRIAIFESTSLVASCLCFYVSGPFIQRYGFIIPQILMLVLFGASALYVLLILKESLPVKDFFTEDTESLLQDTTPVKKMSRVKFVLTKLQQQPAVLLDVLARPRRKRWALYHSIAILTLVSCFTNGLFNLTVLYLMNRPFCFPPLQVGIYLGSQMLSLAIGTMFGTQILLRVLPKYFVAMLSPFFAVISYIMFPMAKTVAVIYGAVAIRGFSSMHTPIFRSAISDIVDDTEQGSIFSIVSVLDTLIMFVGSFVFNLAYSKLESNGNAVLFFYIPAALLMIPLVLTSWFWMRWRKEEHNGQEYSALD